MRKLFIFLVAIFLATSVYALTESDTGPEHITVAWMTGTTDMTSGNVVILQTTSPTYPGKEVTGATVDGLPIYGVVVDTTNYTPSDMAGGKLIRIQTLGYCPIIKLASGSAVTADSAILTTSKQSFTATSCQEVNASTLFDLNQVVTGSSVALETSSSRFPQNITIKGYLR